MGFGVVVVVVALRRRVNYILQYSFPTTRHADRLEFTFAAEAVA